MLISFQIYSTESNSYSYVDELNSNEKEFSPKIHWDLNWLKQDDPKLIKFIKDNLLIPPNITEQGLNLRNQYNDKEPWKHQGQNGEALLIEYVLELNKNRKDDGKFDLNAMIIIRKK